MSILALKVKSKNGQQILKELTAESKVGELKAALAQAAGILAERVTVRSGYPPQILDVSNDAQTLAAAGLRSGDTLLVEESVCIECPSEISEPDPALCRRGILMKKVVPSDNSCLFTSIGG